MKRIIGLFLFSVFAVTLSGQRSVDELFEKYSDDSGFINIEISGNLLSLLKSDDDCCTKNVWPNEVTSVRILIPDESENRRTDFIAAISRDRDLKNYEEYMSVLEKDQDIRMLVRMDGKVIREFLIVGGGEDNFILQLKGRITIEEAEEFSREAKNNRGHISISGL